MEIVGKGVKYFQTVERRQLRRYTVFVVNFENISLLFLVFLLLALNR